MNYLKLSPDHINDYAKGRLNSRQLSEIYDVSPKTVLVHLRRLGRDDVKKALEANKRHQNLNVYDEICRKKGDKIMSSICDGLYMKDIVKKLHISSCHIRRFFDEHIHIVPREVVEKSITDSFLCKPWRELGHYKVVNVNAASLYH